MSKTRVMVQRIVLKSWVPLWLHAMAPHVAELAKEDVDVKMTVWRTGPTIHVAEFEGVPDYAMQGFLRHGDFANPVLVFPCCPLQLGRGFRRIGWQPVIGKNGEVNVGDVFYVDAVNLASSGVLISRSGVMPQSHRAAVTVTDRQADVVRAAFPSGETADIDACLPPACPALFWQEPLDDPVLPMSAQVVQRYTAKEDGGEWTETDKLCAEELIVFLRRIGAGCGGNFAVWMEMLEKIRRQAGAEQSVSKW